MTARKPAPQIVVAPEPWVLSAAEVAGRVGHNRNYVAEHLVFEDGQEAKAKDVPAQIGGGGQRRVFFDLGGGVYLECFKRPNGGICFFTDHAKKAIEEAYHRANHPAAGSVRP